MKENKYDNEIFFEKYSEMNRSKEGLKGAAEWSELKKCFLILTAKLYLIWDAAMAGTANMPLIMVHLMFLVRIFHIKC